MPDGSSRTWLFSTSSSLIWMAWRSIASFRPTRHGPQELTVWLLHTGDDGVTFHICQAVFPGGPDTREKLQRALKAQIDAEAFEHMRGTLSFPFQADDHQRIAVTAIDFRGNEVVRVVPLTGGE